MRQIKGVICILISVVMCWSASAVNDKRYVNIIFIGNSITLGVGLPKPIRDASLVKAVLFLSKYPEVASAEYPNRGQSGCTIADYLPDTNTLFPWVVRAADKFKDETRVDLVSSIILGANDNAIEGANGCPIAPKRYYENVKTIIDRLLALYPNCRIMVHRPLWYSPDTYNGAKYLEEDLRRL